MAERVAAALVERAISGGLQQLAMERSSQPVAWPTSEEFTVEKGEKAIERTVKVQVMTADLSTTHVRLCRDGKSAIVGNTVLTIWEPGRREG